MTFLDALADTWGMTETPEEDASVAAEHLADAVTAWLTGDPDHDLERNLSRVEDGLEAVGERPEGAILRQAVTLLRKAYECDLTSESWHLAAMVREVAGSLGLAA